MIQETSKEQELELLATDGNIAFIGNLTDCSNYAGRFAKSNRTFTWTTGLSKQINLSKPTAPIGLLYYVGEFFDNNLPTNIRENTNLVVVVDDHIDRRNATLVLLSKLAPDIPIQILSAKLSSGLTKEQEMLTATDMLVIRELERMFLKDTELNLQREALRVKVDLDSDVDEFEYQEIEHPVLSIEEIALLDSGKPDSIADLLTNV